MSRISDIDRRETYLVRLDMALGVGHGAVASEAENSGQVVEHKTAETVVQARKRAGRRMSNCGAPGRAGRRISESPALGIILGGACSIRARLLPFRPPGTRSGDPGPPRRPGLGPRDATVTPRVLALPFAPRGGRGSADVALGFCVAHHGTTTPLADLLEIWIKVPSHKVRRNERRAGMPNLWPWRRPATEPQPLSPPRQSENATRFLNAGPDSAVSVAVCLSAPRGRARQLSSAPTPPLEVAPQENAWRAGSLGSLSFASVSLALLLLSELCASSPLGAPALTGTRTS